MSRPSTRTAAAKDKGNRFTEPMIEPGIRGWLAGLPSGQGRPAAAFDTRFDKPVLLTGSAAKGIADRLDEGGYQLVLKPESFFVDPQNRLRDGEADHAAGWGTRLAERAVGAGAESDVALR